MCEPEEGPCGKNGQAQWWLPTVAMVVHDDPIPGTGREPVKFMR